MYPKPSTSHHSAAIIVPWGKHAGETLLSIDNGGDRAYVESIAHLWLEPDRAIVRSAAIVYLENYPAKTE